MKTTLFLGLGVLFWVSQTLKKVHDFLSEKCISASTLQLLNERVSFGAPSYVGRGHIEYYLPLPPSLQSEHSYDFVDQWTSSSGGGNSAAAQQL